MSHPCIIERGARFEGLLSFEERVRVEGVLVGAVVGSGLLEIGATARVEGEVEVGSLRVEGSLDGEVRTSGKTVVCAAGRIRGRIETAALEVSDGASIEGPVTMTPPEPS